MLSPLEKRNNAKYYNFHKDHGNDTEQCNELKKGIENAVRRGELKEFIDDASSKSTLGI